MIIRHFKKFWFHSYLLDNTLSKYTRLNYSIVANKVTFKTQIINGLEDKYRYDRASNALLQFDSSAMLLDKISLNVERVDALDLDWLNAPSTTNAERLERFNRLTSYLASNSEQISITSTDFDAFIDQFTDRMSEFNENEVVAGLQIFARMPLERPRMSTRNFRELFMAFDDNTARCAMNWDYDKRLAVCGIWSVIPLARKCKYITMVCNKFEARMNELTARQFVPAIFYMNALNHIIEDLPKFERNFNRLINDLTIDEIGLVCYAANRKDYRLTNSQLVGNILRRFVTDPLDDVKDIALIQLVKVSF